MEMFIRTLCLYLNYLRYKIKYRKLIWFRGFSVIYAFNDNKITFNSPKMGGVKSTFFPILSAI